MRVIPLDVCLIPDFIDYCWKYGKEHDESFVFIDEFALSPDDPTYLLMDDQNHIVGTISLMLHSNFRAMRRARVRIFHVIESTLENYRLLYNAAAPHLKDFDTVYLFIPEEKKPEIEPILTTLDFKIWRYAWLMERPIEGVPAPAFPAGFTLKPLEWGKDEESYCVMTNRAFSHHLGHVDSTPEKVRQWREQSSDLDGNLLLWKDKTIVGAVLITRNEDEEASADLGGLAVAEEYRGQGLGVNLLRAGIDFARQRGFKTITLSVNDENEKAAAIYVKEGFKKIKLMICYISNVHKGL